MAFSDFKRISEVQEKFRIRYTTNDFLKGESASPSMEFLQEFEFTMENVNVFSSEASRCEAVIFPILREAYKAYADTYALWIREPITYDETLNGTPDYLVATKSELGMTVIGAPLVILVEAKKNDFDQGWGQCLAELVAAQKINDDPDVPVYGIVSDGERWQFGKLVGDTFTQNRMSFSIDNLPNLFGAINTVFKAASEIAVKKNSAN